MEGLCVENNGWIILRLFVWIFPRRKRWTPHYSRRCKRGREGALAFSRLQPNATLMMSDAGPYPESPLPLPLLLLLSGE